MFGPKLETAKGGWGTPRNEERDSFIEQQKIFI
jgi:hypothetical protein